MAFTLAGLRKDAEARKLDAERRLSDSNARKKLMLASVKERGDSRLNTEEDKEFEALSKTAREAAGELASIEGELKSIASVEAEEAESDRKAGITRKTNAGLPADQRTFSAGNGKTLENGAMLYGAESKATEWRYADSGRNAALAPGQSWRDHEAVREYAERNAERDKILTGTHGSLAQQIRALSTTSGSAIVPTEWSWPIIDKARNAAVCLKAGVTVVPMPAKLVQVGRLNADVAPAFKTEGSAIPSSDPGFDFITFTATSLGAITVASLEFLADAPGADMIVSEAIGKAMALELDKAILFGQLLTADGSEGYNLPSPYPKGVLKSLLASAPSQVLGNGTNGTVQTATTMYRELQSLWYSVKRRNEQPGMLVSNDALQQKYVDAYDTQGRVLTMPENIRNAGWLTTNAINSATQGTGTTMSDVFCCDWSQVLLGQRLGMEIRVLTERYAEVGQVGILAYWRGDVQIARLSAAGVYRYLQAAV